VTKYNTRLLNLVSGWLCPRDLLEYYDLVIESMDNDHERRRLTPLAVRSDSKYLDLINGPGSGVTELFVILLRIFFI